MDVTNRGELTRDVAGLLAEAAAVSSRAAETAAAGDVDTALRLERQRVPADLRRDARPERDRRTGMARRVDAQSGAVDVDEAEVAESFELPGADLADEELTVKVLPMQADEFRCSRCFLVHHRSQLATHRNGEYICTECAA